MIDNQGQRLTITHLIYFKIVVDNPSNPQLFVFDRLVIIVDSFTYLCSNDFFLALYDIHQMCCRQCN